MTALQTTAAAQGPDIREIEQVLYREANCLDRIDLDEWMTLYTDDGYYWLPASEDQPDPLNHISITYDNRTLMDVRRNYLKHPMAPSLEHKIRCSHIISNVRIDSQDPLTGNCTVRSNFQAIIYYKTQILFAGTYNHNLVRSGDSYLIQSKRVDLINCDAPHRSIVIYI